MSILDASKICTYAAFQWTTVDEITVQSTDGIGGIGMGIHLDEGKPTIGLEPRLRDEAKVLEQRDEVVLCCVWCQVAGIDGRLPFGRLRNDHLVASLTIDRELVMAERSGRRHAHLRNRLLLLHRWLTLLVSPVAPNLARPKPFAIHCCKRFLGQIAILVCNEAVATRSTCLHVPHDTSLADLAEWCESLEKHFIIHLIRKITDEDMVVVGGVFF